MRKIAWIACSLMLVSIETLKAQEQKEGVVQQDSLGTFTAKSDRNMMLNAETSSVPREINIGLPDSGNGAVLFIDGTKHALGLVKSRMHWSGGNAYEPVGSMSLIESVITTGEIGVMAISNTKLGGDDLHCALTVGTSTRGLAKVDFAINGPIKNNWYYAAGIYANFDPSGVPAPNRYFIDKKQIGTFALTKRWDRASLSAIYRLSFCQDNLENGYNYAPFIYNGDGTISRYNNFKIGTDCYFPSDDSITYLETDTAQKKTESIAGIDNTRVHDISLNGKYTTLNGWNLALDAHLSYAPQAKSVVMTPVGIDESDFISGFTYRNGIPYSGPVQLRMATVKNIRTTDGLINLTAGHRFAKHNIKTGLNLVFAHQYESDATVNFAHTVSANPQRLLQKGKDSWRFNTNAAYVDARRQDIILYAFDEMTLGERVRNKLGLRARYGFFQVNCANIEQGSSINKRVDGFNILDPSLCRLIPISLNKPDGAITDQISCRIAGRLFFTAEGFASLTNKSATYFKGATIPSLKAIGNAMIRGGLSYDNSWMDATLMPSYITSWNNAKVMSVTADIGGKSETIPWTAQYGIGTFGITFDGNFHYKGFKLHTLITWQNPRYKNYTNEFKFSDGSTKVIDYTGKYVTGISQWLVEFDPSYNWSKGRVWASVRYYSKQYASRNNLAWFKGHFETFAGADYRITPSHKLSVNIVNLFFQNGIKGSIDTADTVDDARLLQGILMAGTYIRPFTLELSYSFSF